MQMYTPPTPASQRPQEAAPATLTPSAAAEPPATPTPLADPDSPSAPSVAPSAPPTPAPPPAPGAPRAEVFPAEDAVLLRVSVRGPESPFDDPDAVTKMVLGLLEAGAASFVHEQETLIAYTWEGRVVRKPHTVIEAQTTQAQAEAAEAIIRTHHPDRAPKIQRFTA